MTIHFSVSSIRILTYFKQPKSVLLQICTYRGLYIVHPFSEGA